MFKRTFDIAASFLGLVLLGPIFILVCLLIRLDSRGSAFFLGPRVGKGGKVFRIIKFRTMTEGSYSTARAITVEGDPRVTRIGKFLRRTKVDELPQLWNVLRGDMSLVGPRPEDPRYVALYNDTQRQVLCVRPGITSSTSIEFSNEEALLGEKGFEAYETIIMPQKLAADLEYLRDRTFLKDLKIIFQTFGKIFQNNSKSFCGDNANK